jgi:ABC-2 type transport system permease protein
MVISLIFYPTFRDQATQINQALGHLPPAAKSLFAGNTNASFTTPEDFLSGRVFYLMLPLLLSVVSILIGSSLISKEESAGTIEHLLARPVSRGALLTAKAVAGLVILAVIGVVALITALIVGASVHIGVPIVNIEVATLFAAILSLLFGTLAFMINALSHAARAASAGIAAFVALGSYIVVSLANAVDWLGWPAKFLPHNYYRPSDILYGNYGWQNASWFLLLTALMAIVAWRGFRRRDIGI